MASCRYTAAERRAMHQQNRHSWNAITPVHNSHKIDQAGFLRGGGSTLFADEIELLGDIHGKRLAHLQCNCGQDTLSLAALGAAVIGIDIAEAPIAFARNLSAETGIPARFHQDDVLDWLAATEERFDVAFASYGTIGWLCDLDAWAAGVARILVPGGRLVLLEFHPMIWSFASDGHLADPYFIDGPVGDDDDTNGVRDYVGEGLAPSGFAAGMSEFDNPEPCHSFQWTVAQIVQAVIDAGLRLEVLREYPYANGCDVRPGMERMPGNRYRLPQTVPPMPLMLGLAARASRKA